MKTNIGTTILLLVNLAVPVYIFAPAFKSSPTIEQQIQRANNRSDAMKVYHRVTDVGSWTTNKDQDSIDRYIEMHGEDENIQYLYKKGVIKREHYQR